LLANQSHHNLLLINRLLAASTSRNRLHDSIGDRDQLLTPAMRLQPHSWLCPSSDTRHAWHDVPVPDSVYGCTRLHPSPQTAVLLLSGSYNAEMLTGWLNSSSPHCSVLQSNGLFVVAPRCMHALRPVLDQSIAGRSWTGCCAAQQLRCMVSFCLAHRAGTTSGSCPS
jgi:hypothetical protein